MTMTRDQREARVEELQQWMQEQQDEFGSDAFPDEVQRAWDNHTGELIRHQAILDQLGARDDHLRDLARNGGYESGSGPSASYAGDPWRARSGLAAFTSPTPQDRKRLLDRALAANDRCGAPDGAREHMDKELRDDQDRASNLARWVIAASDPDYLRAFSKWMVDPVGGHREWDARELAAYQRVQTEARSMLIGTPGSGGFLVPYQLDPQILISGTGSINPMRELSTVRTDVQQDSRVVTSLGVTASWDAEEAQVSDDSPTLLQPSLKQFKGQAFVPVSLELFEDSDLQQQVGALFADAKDQLEAVAFTTGDGSAAPEGAVTGVVAVAGSVVTAAGSTLALTDIIANQNALPPRWRSDAVWMANLTMINAARQLPLYTNGPSIVNDARTPPRALGWSLYENSSMDGTIVAGTTNDYVWLSGSFKRGYRIHDRIGTVIELVPTLFGANQRPTGQRGFHMHWRTGGKVIIPDAFRMTNYNA